MTKKSNVWLALMACLSFLCISYSISAQIYGDVIDINGQNNVSIGTPYAFTNFTIFSSSTTEMRLQSGQTTFDFTSTPSGLFSLDYLIPFGSGTYTGTAFSIGQFAPNYFVSIDMKERVTFSKDVDFKGNMKISDPNGNTQFKVSPNGFVTARQVDVNLAPIPDYVFESDYDLMPLSELAGYIQKNKHLPKIKSASEYEEAGSINIGELQLQLLEKVEELTLYTIQQQKELDALKKENLILKEAIQKQLNNEK